MLEKRIKQLQKINVFQLNNFKNQSMLNPAVTPINFMQHIAHMVYLHQRKNLNKCRTYFDLPEKVIKDLEAERFTLTRFERSIKNKKQFYYWQISW